MYPKKVQPLLYYYKLSTNYNNLQIKNKLFQNIQYLVKLAFKKTKKSKKIN